MNSCVLLHDTLFLIRTQGLELARMLSAFTGKRILRGWPAW